MIQTPLAIAELQEVPVLNIEDHLYSRLVSKRD